MCTRHTVPCLKPDLLPEELESHFRDNQVASQAVQLSRWQPPRAWLCGHMREGRRFRSGFFLEKGRPHAINTNSSDECLLVSAAEAALQAPGEKVWARERDRSDKSPMLTCDSLDTGQA